LAEQISARLDPPPDDGPQPRVDGVPREDWV
jgi:hypothetical protein